MGGDALYTSDVLGGIISKAMLWESAFTIVVYMALLTLSLMATHYGNILSLLAVLFAPPLIILSTYYLFLSRAMNGLEGDIEKFVDEGAAHDTVNLAFLIYAVLVIAGWILYYVSPELVKDILNLVFIASMMITVLAALGLGLSFPQTMVMLAVVFFGMGLAVGIYNRVFWLFERMGAAKKKIMGLREKMAFTTGVLILSLIHI